MNRKKTKAEIAATVAARRNARKVEKTAKTTQRQQQDTSPKGTIDPEKTYTRGALLMEFSLGNEWFREAQKCGLVVRPAGRTKFVNGRDLIDFINSGKGAAIISRSRTAKAKANADACSPSN